MKSHPSFPPPATQLFKLMDKYRPETKQAKKERLRERAAARFVLVQIRDIFDVKWMVGKIAWYS